MDDLKTRKRNLIFFPLGTVGRDMIYCLWTNFIMLYILYTRDLTTAQLAAVTGIMVAARVFDALNDPIMGNIIERTRTKHGKFKPWLAVGLLATCVVVYLAFNTSLEGWSFIYFFGAMYFLYSITYTMNDISYWGMVPALSSDANARNQFTARATLFAGIGSTAASMLIPLFTAGEHAIGGSAGAAYGRIALVICVLAPIFVCFTLFGVRERRDDMKEPAPPLSFKKIVSTIGGNDQLMWMSLIFLLQQVGNGLVISGIGTNYIYFEFGYEGGLWSLFNTVGMMATAVLMVGYPALSRKVKRKSQMKVMAIISVIGYIVQLGAGVAMPSSMLKFWIMTLGFMLANFGQYGFYLIMMISIINTVEYNELYRGTRDEAIITSLRPFLTKLGSALYVAIASLSYMLFNVTEFTNKISALERAAEVGTISAAEKSAQIAGVLSGVTHTQTVGLLMFMTVLPCALMLTAYFLYIKKYKLDEDEYERICAQLEARKAKA